MCQRQARALAGPLTAPRGKGSKLSKCRVYSGKGQFPLLATPYPTLQRICTLIALPSTSGASGFPVGARWICQYPSTVPAPIVPWQYHQFPGHASLCVTSISQELL